MFWIKEYGGDEGWPFIEDASYNELIAAILRDVDREEAAQDANQIMQDQNHMKVWFITAFNFTWF